MAGLEPVASPDAQVGPARSPDRAGWGRLALLLGLVAAGVAGGLAFGPGEGSWGEKVAALRGWIDAQGSWGPAVFVVGYVLAEMAFVPALPLTMLGGAVFGPVRGTAYVSLASTLAAVGAFLVARHLARGVVERWIARQAGLARIDEAVTRHGWRILMVTRLVPLFPFSLQNFAYGLTRIPLRTFVLTSWLAMLPGTAAYVLAGAALGEARDLRQTTAYLAGAGLLIVGLSLLPGWLSRRSQAARDLLGRRGAS